MKQVYQVARIKFIVLEVKGLRTSYAKLAKVAGSASERKFVLTSFSTCCASPASFGTTGVRF